VIADEGLNIVDDWKSAIDGDVVTRGSRVESEYTKNCQVFVPEDTPLLAFTVTLARPVLRN